MRSTVPQSSWPDSWVRGHGWDLAAAAESAEDFRAIPGGYADAKRGYARAYRNRLRVTLDAIRRVAPPGSSILDVAAGQGNFSLALAELGYQVTWNDRLAELAGYVQLKYERGSIRYAPGDVFDLECEHGFDLVLIAEVIEHVAHPDAFLSRIASLVKPGGYVVMTTPNGEYWSNKLPRFSDCSDPSLYEASQFEAGAYGHIFLLHADEVESLAAAAGLAVRELRVFNNVLTSGFAKTEALLAILPRALVSWLEEVTAALSTPVCRKLNTQTIVVLQKLAPAPAERARP
jgi:2-polyprenyl-6-hydroxyphenyl methylase/3-demethylubiquinone-9 3-methyltransferase